MNISEICTLSAKYLIRYRRRYLFLFSALTFGFCIVTIITAIKEGISENLYFSAQTHYTGDIIFLGNDRNSWYTKHIDVPARKAIIETIKESKLPVLRYAERTLCNDEALLFFNGESVNLRYLNGVDWDNEQSYFDSLRYIDGGTADLNDDSIVISEQVMSLLGLKCGDSLTMEILDRNKQKNTWVFEVKAVIKDTSVFGFYKAYISRKIMNYLLGFAPEDSSSIGIFLKDRRTAEKDKVTLRNLLAQKMAAAPLFQNRDEFDKEWKVSAKTIRVFVVTIPVYLAELYQLIEAVNILNYFLYFMMLIIIFASASITYRLILNERIKEIGTMRAIGFSESDVRYILAAETGLLGTVSVTAGFCFSCILKSILSSFVFIQLPGFEIMLADGKLSLIFAPLVVLINIVAIYTMLFTAVIIPAGRMSKSPLAEMLSGGMKE